MQIVFFGTADIAVPALAALARQHQVLAVVTATDKKKGRGLHLGLAPVKITAQQNGWPVLQPADLGDHSLIRGLKEKKADLFVVCAYGKILPKEILKIPRIYTINLHMSLLPKYRGAAPINWAIINGEQHTGVTIFKMDEHMDQGDIILQKEQPILDADTSESLGRKLAGLGKTALLEALELISQGKAELTKQRQEEVSLAPKLKKEDGLIDWGRPALEIHNRVRGLQPWPGAHTYFRDRLLKIWESEVIPAQEKRTAGGIIMVEKKGTLAVDTGKESLLLKTLQLAGKRKMSAREFITGHKIEIGERLGR